MAIALLEIPVSGCTCLSTANIVSVQQYAKKRNCLTFVDIRTVCLLSSLSALLLLTLSGRCGLFGSLFGSGLLGFRCLRAGRSWGLASSGCRLCQGALANHRRILV
jgi:hypothetical protein